MSWDKVVKVIVAIAALFGGWDPMMQVLVAVMLIDWVTGVIVSLIGKSPKTETGHLDSKVGFAGLLKKALIMAVVFLSVRLDSLLPSDQAVFRSMTCWFYVANEGISVLENLALAGVPFPAVLKKALEQLQKKALPKEEADPE